MRGWRRLRTWFDHRIPGFELQVADSLFEYGGEIFCGKAIHADTIQRVCVRRQNVEMHIAEGELLSGVEVINPPQLRLLIGRRRSTRRCVPLLGLDQKQKTFLVA